MINPYFDNRSVGNMITVDLDVFFDDFVREQEEIPEKERPGFTRDSVVLRMMRIEGIIQEEVVRAEYRRSSNGHVHFRAVLSRELSVLDAFIMRATFWDDQQRLALDMARYLFTGSLHEINRCFDEKATFEGVKVAGPWIPLHSGKSTWTLEVRDDFESFDFKTAHEKAKKSRESKPADQWDIKIEESKEGTKQTEISDLGFL